MPSFAVPARTSPNGGWTSSPTAVGATCWRPTSPASFPVCGPRSPSCAAGVVGFVRAAALEEQGNGVRFTSVLPGVVATELMEKRPVPPTAEVRAQSLQPEDVAATVLFALSLPERACVAELTVLPTALQVLGRT